MLPNFVVIGAQKSASTFLQDCLSEHHEVFMPEGETSIFESPDYEQSDLSRLERLFKNRREKAIGIRRPNYIGKPEVPKRIEAHLPDAKLIAILRNPVDRAVSAYFHNIKYGFISPIDIEEGMRQLIARSPFSKRNRRFFEILEFSYYYKYLSKYQHFIENNQLLVLLHEELLSNPLTSVQKAYGFLDVCTDFTPKSLNSRPQAVIYNLKRLRFLSLRNRFMYDYNPERTKLFSKNMNMLDKVIAKVVGLTDQQILSRILRNDKPEVSPELREMIYEKYARDIEALETLIGKNLKEWKFSRSPS